MNKTIEKKLRLITRGLTGRREMDIVFLQENIEKYRDDQDIAKALKRILGCLTVAEMHPSIMIA